MEWRHLSGIHTHTQKPFTGGHHTTHSSFELHCSRKSDTLLVLLQVLLVSVYPSLDAHGSLLSVRSRAGLTKNNLVSPLIS